MKLHRLVAVLALSLVSLTATALTAKELSPELQFYMVLNMQFK
jgi:hypothetical protein